MIGRVQPPTTSDNRQSSQPRTGKSQPLRVVSNSTASQPAADISQHQSTYETLLLKENHSLRDQLEQLSRKLQDLMDSNCADKRTQISELQSLRDLVKRQAD